MATDAELVGRVAEGDLDALRLLYDSHAAWLSVRLLRRCNDPEVVSDALQDTFVALWKEARRFRGDGEVAAWLWGIAVRRLVSRIRSRKDVLFLIDISEATSPAAEDLVLRGVEYGDLGTALAQLSPEMRAVIQAVVLDGLTTKEAARLLSVPENTVKTRLHRAKGHLRTSLTEVPA